ncbi:hypothetical protein INT45_006326, partial [Circinella minor]
MNPVVAFLIPLLQFFKHQNEMIDRFMEVDHVVEALKQGEDPEEYIHHRQELEEQQ